MAEIILSSIILFTATSITENKSGKANAMELSCVVESRTKNAAVIKNMRVIRSYFFISLSHF